MVNLEPALFFLCWERGFSPSDSKSPKHLFFLPPLFLSFFYLENHRVRFLFHADKYIIVVLCVQCCQ